ncbi:MAG TPA: hypothetical protein GX691_03420 [Clostridia bacterium]|nr:hypothetical protein [Clostridia bacterium]
MVFNVLVRAFQESVNRDICMLYNYKKIVISGASKDLAREMVMMEVSHLREMNAWLSGILEDMELETDKKTGKSAFTKDRQKRLWAKLDESMTQLEAVCSRL